MSDISVYQVCVITSTRAEYGDSVFKASYAFIMP